MEPDRRHGTRRADPPSRELPKFNVTVARPTDFDDQLKGLRPGRPLVRLGLSRPADFAAYSEPGAAVLEGRYANGAGGRTIRANIIMTDPLCLLGEAAKIPRRADGMAATFCVARRRGCGTRTCLPPCPVGRSRVTGHRCLLQALGIGTARRMNLEESHEPPWPWI